MFTEKVSEKVEALVEPIINGLGYELVEATYLKKNDGMNLTIYINSAKGITIDDCEIVHKAVDEPLDELDPTKGQPYILSVSSLGLDRPIKSSKDFQRNLGKIIEVKLFKPLDGKKLYTGKLESFTEDVVVLDIDNNQIKIERKFIANAVLHLEF